MVVKDNEWLDHCTCDDLTARNCICDLNEGEQWRIDIVGKIWLT